MAGKREHAWWPAVVLGLSALAVHTRELLGGRPYFRDLHQVYVPAKLYLAQRLQAGELPEWWPWDGGGSPLVPQPVFSVFHPSTLFYFLLPFWSAFAIQNLWGTATALFGAYVLARTLGLSRAASTVSGALYGLSGYLACLTEHQFMKLAAGTMPWYLAAIVLAWRRKGAWTLAPAAAMGLLLLAGDPQIAILSAAAGLVFAVVRASRERLRALAIAVLSPLTGAAIAAVQLVPSLAVLPDTERGRAMEAERWALAPRHLVGMIWPWNFGQVDWVRSTLFGWAGVALVLASVLGFRVTRRRRVLLGLWGLTLASMWLACGRAAGLHTLARAIVPIWSQLRYPMKSIVLAYLTLALLAGFGLDHLASRRLRPRGVRWLAVAALPVAAFGLVDVPSGVSLSLLAAGLAGAIGLAATRPRLAALVTVTSITALAMPLFLTTTSDYYEAPPIARALQAAGVGLTGPYFDRPFAPVVDESLWAALTRGGAGGLGTSLGAVYGLPSLTPSLPGSSWRVLKLFDAAHREVTNSRLLGVYGVEDVVLREPVEARLRPQVIASDADSGYSVVQVRHRLERAYATSGAKWARHADEALAMVSAPDFLPGREVVLEGTPDARSHTAASPAIPSTVEPRTSANSVRVRASLPAAGYVVLNEANFRGWTAEVDAQPARVLTANGLMRAVQASRGDHEIVFRFHTPGLTLGLLISITTLLIMVAFTVVLIRRAPTRIAVGP